MQIEIHNLTKVYNKKTGRNQIRLSTSLQSIPQYVEVPPNIEAKESFHTFLLFSPLNLTTYY